MSCPMCSPPATAQTTSVPDQELIQQVIMSNNRSTSAQRVLPASPVGLPKPLPTLVVPIVGKRTCPRRDLTRRLAEGAGTVLP